MEHEEKEKKERNELRRKGMSLIGLVRGLLIGREGITFHFRR